MANFAPQKQAAIVTLKDQLEQKQLNPKAAREWLLKKARGIKTSRAEMIQDKNRLGYKMEIGKMFFFYYDPKTKATLPYWDKFPLVFPIEAYNDGFLGINLHYLSPPMRALLLDKLMDTANNKKMDETTRLNLSYQLLASTKKYKAFQPCIKRYLYSHIWSKFIAVEADEWKVAVVLPYQSFEGASAAKVWNDSRKMI